MRLVVGVVLKPQGIKGEIKVKSLLDSTSCFLGLKQLYIDDKTYEITTLREQGGFLYIKLSGVDTMNDAELLRCKELEIPREKLPKLPNDRFFVQDIIGLKVFVEGACVGVLSDVLQYGAADVYCVQSGDDNFMFPAIKDVIESISVEQGEIHLVKDKLKEVIVYED